MKHLKILLIVFFVAIHFTACKKENLHVGEIIKKHHLAYYPYWDSEYTPFRENATIYANKKTDSCLLILKNKKGDTILCHLDKNLERMKSLEYKKINNEWVIKKRGFSNTANDSTDTWEYPYDFSSYKSPIDEYYTIDRKKKILRKFNLISKTAFLKKIAKKYRHLKNCTPAAFENNMTYVFKDTLDDQQVLYLLGTTYEPKCVDGNYILEPKFESAYSNGLFKNRVYREKDSDYYYFGEQSYYGKNAWQFEYRYKISSRKYYKFKVHRNYNKPGNELFKTEIIVEDCKNNTTKIIKNFPKDSLFKNNSIVFEKQRNGKFYIGIKGADFSTDFFNEFDTVSFKVTKIKLITKDRKSGAY